MRYRGALVGLALFMVVAVALTWLVYVTLRRDVAGRTVPYAAVFTDVFGLREGDDVRMAGVRVGRVESIELQGDLAKVSFVVQTDQQVLGTTVASVTYQNIVGQRYLGLSLGKLGEPGPLPPDSVIPVERTDPSFDVGTLLNGYEPLFSVLNPRDADNLTKGVVQSLQGDTGSITALVDQTSPLTESFAGRDEELGAVITDLNTVVANLAEAQRRSRPCHHRNPKCGIHFRCTASRAGGVDGGDARRWCANCRRSPMRCTRRSKSSSPESPGSLSTWSASSPSWRSPARICRCYSRDLRASPMRAPYANAYACDLNIQGFFPGLNDVIPIIVNAASPGPGTQYSPKCRNMANG